MSLNAERDEITIDQLINEMAGGSGAHRRLRASFRATPCQRRRDHEGTRQVMTTSVAAVMEEPGRIGFAGLTCRTESGAV